MADKRRSFINYEDWNKLILTLPDEAALQLSRAICAYQLNIDYEITDIYAKSIFESAIKNKIDDNEGKYQAQVERANSLNNGKKQNDTKQKRNNNDVVKNNNDVVKNNNDVVKNNNDVVKNNNDVVKNNNDVVRVNVNVNDNVNNNNINNNINYNKREKGKRENGEPFSETALKNDDDILIKPKPDSVANSENKTKVQDVVNDFNSICLNLPKIKTLSEQRKRVIKIRLKSYPRDKLCEAFKLANSSSFLCGDNTRSWTATFDWIMQESNLAKILDGNYENKDGTHFNQVNYAQNSRFNNFSQREKSEEEKIDLERKLLRSG